MRSLISKPARLMGHIDVPPSKSQTMRAILFASLATGKSTIRNYLKSPDVTHMIMACRQFGANIKVSEHCLEIYGVSGNPQLPSGHIDCGNSGQILHFVSAVYALTNQHDITITGDHSIQTNRPITELMKGLEQLGASVFSLKNNQYAPFVIRGPIKAGSIRINGAISQNVSAFLIASSLLDGCTEILVDEPGETPWVDVTLAWLKFLGIAYEKQGYQRYVVHGQKNYEAFNYTVPGDFSSAAYPMIGALISGSHITIHNLDMDDPQGDKLLINALSDLGANIEYDKKSLALQIQPSSIKGQTVDMNDFVDAVTILAVLGCYATGSMNIVGASYTRFKECNRLAVITKQLTNIGASIEETKDGLLVHPSKLSGGITHSHQDHRIAMSLAIAALGCKNPVVIQDVNCINKSFPLFVESMNQLGADLSYISDNRAC